MLSGVVKGDGGRKEWKAVFKIVKPFFSTTTILIVRKGEYFDCKDCCQTHLGLQILNSCENGNRKQKQKCYQS